MCLCLIDPAMGARGSGSRFDASVQFVRSSLYNGLRSDYVERLDQLMDNRLAVSSMRTVTRAADLWHEAADAMGWPYVIETDDEERGAKLATFGIYLMDRFTDLTFDTINGYLWGMRRWQTLQHQADPALGVMNYGEFLQSLKVVTWVPHEPRRELPIEKIKLMLEAIDPHSFWEVNFGLFAVLLLFTFSRSESGCPKHHTGEESFDQRKHWSVRDIVVRMTTFGHALAVLFKATKTDQRIERPTARGGEPGAGGRYGNDWVYVGDVPGVFSVFTWYRRYMSFFPQRRPSTDPFFLAKDMRRAYTYTAAMADLRALLARVSEDVNYGLHSFRVAGYNASLRSNGEALTVAHGGWESAAHHRYHRFGMRAVLGIAANMVDGENVYANHVAPRVPQRAEVVRGDEHDSAPNNAAPTSPASTNPYEDSDDPEDAAGVPPTTRVTRGMGDAAETPPVARPVVIGTVVSPVRTRARGGAAGPSTSTA